MPRTPGKQIVFIDSAVEDRTTLVAGIGPDIEITVLQRDRDGLEQIAALLSSHTDWRTVHLICHGEPGALLLGGTRIGQSDLPGHAQSLRRIADAMHEDAQWLVYACELASGKAGRRFVDAFSGHVGAPVAAASHKVGAQARGHRCWAEVDSRPQSRQNLHSP